MPASPPNPSLGADLFVSILIPARNEALSIKACLLALQRQSYPAHRFEVIVIDDDSTDHTAELAAQYGAKVLHLPKLSRAHKKAAIALGLQHAQGQFIVTTDADTLSPPHWLSYLVSCYEAGHPLMMAAPVGFYEERNALERFQSLDFLGMMVLTGAGIQQNTLSLCNGANLAYEKAAFMAVGGFADSGHYASGDDMFLMQKIKHRFPGRLAFVKHPEAMVLTRAQATWGSFISQRLRWASKMGAFYNGATLLFTAVPFLMCWAILMGVAAIPWLGWTAAQAALLLFGAKALADYCLLRTACRFFGRRDLLSSFWLSQFFHLIYIAGIGLASFFIKKYYWKGRRLN